MAETHIGGLRSEMPDLFEVKDVPAGLNEWEPIPIGDPYSLEPNEYETDIVSESGLRQPIPPVPVDPGEFGGAFDPDSASADSSNGSTVPPPEAWAFYLPYHYFNDRWWGVYLLYEGVDELTGILLQFAQHTISFGKMRPAARVFLFGHELYHHCTEAFSSRLEVSHRKPLYRDGTNGFQSLYSRTYGTDDCDEEALANAYAYLKVKDRLSERVKQRRITRADADIILGALRTYIDKCPPGYRMGTYVLEVSTFDEEQNCFAEANHAECRLAPSKKSLVWDMFQHSFHPFINCRSRVNYLVHKGSPLAARHRMKPTSLRFSAT